MSSGQKKTNKLEQLRKQAEQLLNENSDGTAQDEADKMQTLVYELQVYQTELEMQNEELMYTRAIVEQSYRDYSHLYEFAPIGYFTMDLNKAIRKVNLMGCQLLGYNRNYVLSTKYFDTFVVPQYHIIFQAFIDKILNTHQKQTCELQVIRKGNEIIYVQLEGMAMEKDLDGNSQYLVAMIDITARKKSELALYESQRFAQQIAESMPDMLHVYDLTEQKTVYVNQGAEKLLGYTSDEMVQMGEHVMESLVHPDDLQACLAQIQYFEHTQRNEARELEVRIRDKWGNWLWVWARYSIFKRAASGQPDQILGIVHNITEKKEREQQLRQSEAALKKLNETLEQQVADRTRRLEETFKQLKDEFLARKKVQEALQLNQERFQVALEKAPVSLFTYDAQLKYTWVHNQLWRDGESVIGKTENEVFPPETAQMLTTLKSKVLSTGKGIRQEIRLKVEGSLHYFDLTLEPILDERGTITGIACAAIDITQRKKAEAQLIRSEKQYRLLAESIPEMVWTTGADGKLNYANQWMITYSGLPEQSLLADGWMQLVHPEDVLNITQTWHDTIASGEHEPVEARFRRADGEYFWHVRRAVPFKSKAGTITKWIGTYADIHDQKSIEETLRNNEELRIAQQALRIEKEFSENLIDNSIDGIIAFDTTPAYTAWNKVVESIFHVSKAEVVGKKVFDVFPDYQYTEEGQAIMQVLQGKKVTIYHQLYETREGFYEMNLVPLFDDNKQVIGGLGILHDITERVKLEEERTNLKLQQQKTILYAILEAQETERKRIAEALHNGLGQTLYATKLNLEQIDTSKAKHDVKNLQHAKQRINDLLAEAIRQTRNISHELTPNILQDFGLEGAVKDFCKKYTQDNFKITTEIYGFDQRLDKSLEIAIYRITQELVNNIVKHAKATQAKVQLVNGETGILIRVSDNGKGFEASNASIKSQGIGLKTITDRVKLLNGTIDIESNPNCGTTIIIKILHEPKP